MMMIAQIGALDSLDDIILSSLPSSLVTARLRVSLGLLLLLFSPAAAAAAAAVSDLI
jgi:hypothetical protein